MFAVDSNTMIATVSDWHIHHEPAKRAVRERLERKEPMVVPAPAVVEAYSVLTRLPITRRMTPSDAWNALEASFVSNSSVYALSADAYRSLLARVATDGIIGGRVYDTVVAECARLSGVNTLVTINAKHFDPPPAGVEIVDPTADDEAPTTEETPR